MDVSTLLRAVKFARDRIAFINDGPENVKRTAAALLQLDSLLRQLEQRDMADTNSALLNEVKQCHDTLSKFADKIVELQVRPGERVGGKMRNTLRLSASEKDLDEINMAISHHYSRLDLFLSASISTTVLDLNDSVRQVSGDIQSLHEASQTNQTGVQQTASSINDLRHETNTRLTATEHTIIERSESVQKSIESLGASSASRSQMDTVQQQLAQIFEHLKISSNQASESMVLGEINKEGASSGSVAHSISTNSTDERLFQVLDRLGELMSESQLNLHPFDDDDPAFGSIIEDLGSILDAAREQTNIITNQEAICPPCRAAADDASRTFARFGKTFGKTGIMVNPNDRRIVNKRKRSSELNEQQDSIYQLELPIGSVALQRKKRSYNRARAEKDSEEVDARTNYTTTVTFLPRDTRRHRMLVASEYVSRSMRYGGSTSISYLAVNPVLLLGSYVFDVVASGDVQQLREMLQCGEASLRSCDELGASLLFYGNQNPAMCKFLLSHGLDVDHVGRYDFGEPSTPMTALMLPAIDDDLDHEEVQQIHECREMLIMAGSDPIARFDESGESFLQDITIHKPHRVVKFVRQSISIGLISLADVIGHHDKYGNSLLHLACSNMAGGSTADNISAVLDLGFDINATNNQGQTCLSLFLQYSGNSTIPPYAGQNMATREQKTLILLLQRGADPRIPNIIGDNALAVAYVSLCWHFNCPFGSYHGDILDSALHICGYDISESRGAFQRIAKYTKKYTRDDFEQLWRGRESQCPYWDDAPWPPEATLATAYDTDCSENEDQSHKCWSRRLGLDLASDSDDDSYYGDGSHLDEDE